MRTASVVCRAMALLALWPAVASAQPAAEPLKGRTVTMIIGSGAGGGIDLYGRDGGAPHRQAHSRDSRPS